MMIEQHYDEEILIGLLDEQNADPHLESCSTCKAALNSIRQVTSALHDDTVWDRRDLSEEPRPETRRALNAFASSVATEDAAAAPWAKTLLARPASEWRAMVDAHPEWKTAGFVRKLIAAVDAINFTAPADAVDLMKIAVDVAEGLPGGGDRVAKLRAAAWREYAYALYYVGAYHHAVECINKCDQYLSECRTGTFDSANSSLVRASILGGMERLQEAIQFVRTARETFAEYAATQRVLVANLLEGAMLTRLARHTEALAAYKAVLADAQATGETHAGALLNSAFSCRELSRLDEAKSYLSSAMLEFECLGIPVGRTKARWSLGQLLATEGRYAEAIDLYTRSKEELAELGMSHDVALCSIDTAESLLLAGQPAAVVSLCTSAISFFAEAKLTYSRSAMTALAYLREAAATQVLTLTDVRQVRSFIEMLPKQPELLFARPS
jgi:tetratricopeptide (TPR) repeat protein